MSSTEGRRNYEGRLRRVLAHIDDHLDGELSLDELAGVAAMSRFHWHRVFHAMTGETLADAVRRLRLLRAANALVQDAHSIRDVAARHGYANIASFTRAFTASHGLSPMAFRKRGIRTATEVRRRPGDATLFDVAIQDLPAKRGVGVLHVGPLGDLARAFQALGATLSANALFPHTSELFALYHDAPASKAESDMRTYVGVVATAAFPAAVAGLEDIALTGGRHAVLTHKGPYATLGSAYAWLYGVWLPQSGEEPRDAPPVEVYLNDPRVTAPADLRVEIRLPLV